MTKRPARRVISIAVALIAVLLALLTGGLLWQVRPGDLLNTETLLLGGYGVLLIIAATFCGWVARHLWRG